MAHIWFMHDAHLGCAFFFLDLLAEYTLLSMIVMVTPCLWYVVGMNLVCPMSKFPQAPFARAPFGESRETFGTLGISRKERHFQGIVLPALLQKLVGDFFILGGKFCREFGGNFAGFFRTPK